MNAYVARQPILNRDRQVFGYELLFRSGPSNAFPEIDPDEATSSLIDNSLFTFGLNNLVGNNKAFINFTRETLLNGVVTLFPKETVVVEILETIEPDEEVVKACKQLKDQGYALALDDFVYNPAYEALLDLANYVKVDIMQSSEMEARNYARTMRKRGIIMLAEKVENYDEFGTMLQQGYALFQGYFFCKPEMMSGKAIPQNKMAYLQLLQQLQEPELDFDAIEETIRQDPSLSIKLLRLINSAAIGFRVPIESIRHAIVMLGEIQMRKWGSLIALQDLGDDKPTELLVICIFRARLCELLGDRLGLRGHTLDLFLTGLFSAIDAVMDRSLDDIIEDVSPPSIVAETLRGVNTKITPVYHLTLAYERGNWETATRSCYETGASPSVVAELYQEALNWTLELFRL